MKQRKNIQKKAGNPVIAKAEKKIPGRWNKAKKWINKHKRTIFLTVEGLTALALAYYWNQQKFRKYSDKLRKETIKQTRESAKVSKKAMEGMESAVNMVSYTAKQQAKQAEDQKLIMKRLEALHETLADPKFKEYLAKKHGITNLTGVKK